MLVQLMEKGKSWIKRSK